MSDHPIAPIRPARRSPRALVALLAWTLAAAGVASPLAPAPASASSSEEELQAMRDHWQDRYRHLLRVRGQLKNEIEQSKAAYARAQRRNYPRGGARQQFLLQAQQAEKALAETQQEIEALFTEARFAEVPPGWLYEVEDEPIDLSPRPASPDDAGDAADREGRNPLHFEQEDEG